MASFRRRLLLVGLLDFFRRSVVECRQYTVHGLRY